MTNTSLFWSQADFDKLVARLDSIQSQLNDLEGVVMDLRRYAAESRLHHWMEWGCRALNLYTNQADQQTSARVVLCIQKTRESAAQYQAIIENSPDPEADVQEWLQKMTEYCQKHGLAFLNL